MKKSRTTGLGYLVAIGAVILLSCCFAPIFTSTTAYVATVTASSPNDGTLEVHVLDEKNDPIMYPSSILSLYRLGTEGSEIAPSNLKNHFLIDPQEYWVYKNLHPAKSYKLLIECHCVLTQPTWDPRWEIKRELLVEIRPGETTVVTVRVRCDATTFVTG